MDYTPIIKALKQWGLHGITSVKSIYYTGNVFLVSTSHGRRYVLKEKKNPHKLVPEYKLLSALHSFRLPVANLVSNKRDHYTVQIGEKKYCLYNYIDGSGISGYYTENAKEQAKTVGKAIAELHKGMRACGDIEGYPYLDLFSLIFDRSLPVIKKHSGNEELKHLEALENSLKGSILNDCAKLPVQLIHGDMHPGNLLFRKGVLKGYIDFDSVVIGSRVFDIGYCSAYMLIRGFSDQNRREQWRTLSDALIKGYSKTNPLHSYEEKNIDSLILCSLLFFSAVFYGVNNGETAQKTKEAALWVYDNFYR